MSLKQQLSTDIANLSSESKRRNPEIRHASDKSLEILKTLHFHSNEDDPNALKGLAKHPDFINPFLLSCYSKNAKFISIALKCLSILIQFQSLPVTKLDQLIDAFLESTHSSNEIQVKILQILPSFFQNYSIFINGESLSKLLFVCSSLQSANKMISVINTAQATFFQLLDIAFEKVNEEDRKITEAHEVIEQDFEVPVDNDKKIKVAACAFDAQRLISDLCTLIEHHKPLFLKTNYITEDYGFEILETLIKNNQKLFLKHIELAFLLRTRVAPILLRFVSSSKDFTLMVRVSRLVFLLIVEEFDVLKIESEVTLSLLTHILSKDSGSPMWKKTMCLEIFAGIFKNSELTKKIFLEYDNNSEEERKKVVDDFFHTCFTFVNESRALLNTGDLIQRSPTVESLNLLASPSTSTDISSPHSNSTTRRNQGQYSNITTQDKFLGLSSTKSSLKQRYIDSIDKSDPPQAPESYNLYLIAQSVMSLSETICKSTLDLTSNSLTDTTDDIIPSAVSFLDDSIFEEEKMKNLKPEYDCICDLTKASWKLLLSIYKIFMYSTLDNEIFSSLLRSLQKLCHSSGILSISEPRNEILVFFAVSTLKLTGRNGYQSKVLSFGESIVDTISSTIGQAVSNISSTNITDSPNSQQMIRMYTRNINSRQTLCFRALISLAVSLGEILEDNWKIILVALQWISYFIDGPSGIKMKDIPPMSPYLINSDLQAIESSLKKLKESIFNQSTGVFIHLSNSIMSLSDDVMLQQHEDQFGQVPIGLDDNLQPCIFNKTFFLDKLTDVCQINPLKFLIESDKTCDYVNEYFGRLADNRSFDDETRWLANRSLDDIIKSCAVSGFESGSKEIRDVTEKKILSSLHTFMVNLSKLPLSQELLVTNCEVEMYLQTLDTLKNIIDRFGNQIQNNWDIVTAMLNFPFDVISSADDSMIKEQTINDIIISVLKSAFETLKVILDEILQSIPKTQIRVIIDSLYNFVTQQFDLNISFNSISYFWLISDYIKDKIDTGRPFSINPTGLIKSEIQLNRIVCNDKIDENLDECEYYQFLWVYLVLKLAKTTLDPRAQVRNGAIITLFNVIESFGSDTSLSELIYNIVLEPVILSMEIPEDISLSSSFILKDWMESFTNIVNGLTKLFTQHLSNFEDIPDSNVNIRVKFWGSFTDYLIKLVNLDYGWIELNNQIFKSYHNILEAFETQQDSIKPIELIENLYKPWVQIKISYNLSNSQSYQESLCSFVDCFSLSMRLFKPIFSLSKFEKMLMVLNSCIRYPILTTGQGDDKKPTLLQVAVLNSLADLSFDSDHSKYESLLIQQLNLIVVMPFSTRELIVKKLGDKGVKIPTFIAASYRAILIMTGHLEKLTDIAPFLNDRCLLKVYRSLLEPSKLKNNIEIVVAHEENIKVKYFWMESLHILVSLSLKIGRYIIDTPDINKILKQDIMNQLWPSMLSVMDACFIYTPYTHIESGVEDFDLLEYVTIRDCMIELFNFDIEIDRSIVEEFVVSIWTSSFLYQLDELDNHVLETSSSTKDVSIALTCSEMQDNYGSTLPLEQFPRKKIAKRCLTDLIELSDPTKEGRLWELTLPYFISRCCFSIKRFLADEKLLNKKPLPRVQQVEMKTVIHGLATILSRLDETDKNRKKFAYNQLFVLYPLLVKSMAVDAKILGIADSATVVCTKLGLSKLEILRSL